MVFEPYVNGIRFYIRIIGKLMAMQFVIMKPLLTIIPIISLFFGYDFNNIHPFEGFIVMILFYFLFS